MPMAEADKFHDSNAGHSPANQDKPADSSAYQPDPVVDGSNEGQQLVKAGPGRYIRCPKTNIVYKLGESIGSGAAAVVFKCQRVLPGTPGSLLEKLEEVELAAKVLDLRGLKLRNDYVREKKKIGAEVSILSQLHHPCIVNLLHVIETRDELYLIMELIKGGELFYKITERGSLSEDQARYVLLQILSALDYMHRKGIIHRDLKPENILVSSENSGFFRVKVADFGLAKLVLQGLSEAKTFVGTPQYWAPEVVDRTASSLSYGPEVDLWSLGCVIYVMLGGSYPFDTRRGPIEKLIKNAVYHFGYPRWRTISEDAKNLVRGLLTVDPKRRMTLTDILQHPWLTTYRIPPSIPPLPSLDSYKNERAIQIAGLSILRSLPVESAVHGRTIGGLLQNNDGPRSNLVDEGPNLESPDKVQLYSENKENQASNYSTFWKVQAEPFYPQSHFHHPQSARTPPIRGLPYEQPDDTLMMRQLNCPILPQRFQQPFSAFGIAPEGTIALGPAPAQTQDAVTHFVSPIRGEADNRTEQELSKLVVRDDAVDRLSDPNLNHGSPIADGITQTRVNKGSSFRKAQILLNFDELLEFQVYIMRKFQLAYIALRRCPETANALRKSIGQVQDVQFESVQVVRQFEATCSSVLRVLPDLSLAVRERQPQLAVDLFGDIRMWVDTLKAVVSRHQEKLACFSRSVTDLVENIRQIKAAADENFSKAAMNLSWMYQDGRGSRECPRIHSVDSKSPVETQTGGPPSRATTIDTNESLKEEGVDPYEKNCVKFLDWSDDVRETVLARLEALFGKPANEAQSADSSVDLRNIYCDERGTERVVVDVLDLLFTSPGSWAEYHRKLAKRKCLPSDPHQHDSNSDSCQKYHRNSRRPSLPLSGTPGCSTLKGRFQQRPHSSPDSPRSEPSGKCIADEARRHGRRFSFHPPQHLVATRKDNVDKVSGTRHGETPRRRTSQRRMNDNRWTTGQQLYCHALKTSKILVTALDEVRRVDQVLRQAVQFWVNFTVIVEQLCQMKSHTERLLHYCCASPKLASRFVECLSEDHDFWTALSDQCRRYIMEAESKMRNIQEFALALESTADQVDTANAHYMGQTQAAIWGS